MLKPKPVPFPSPFVEKNGSTARVSVVLSIPAELDLENIVQSVTDAGVALIGADFGAFFYNLTDENGESMTLYALSGADRSDFAGYPHPRATAVFKPTFDGTENVRSDDITVDPRYGQSSPYFGLPKGHLPVRSYLAVPVKSRSGEVLGGLFFGHKDAAEFSAADEELISGIASQAAIAVDNARLYQAAQNEIEQRKRAEQHQHLLINELNHRVKNTLSIVQSLAQQSFKGETPPEIARSLFDAQRASPRSRTSRVAPLRSIRLLSARVILCRSPGAVATR